MKWIPLVASVTVAAALLTIASPRPRLLIQPSASMPRGLYWLDRDAPVVTGNLAALRLAPADAQLLAQRGYLAAGWPLIKPVVAATGDTVCRDGAAVTVNGRLVAQAHQADADGRRLPQWSGCRTLDGQVFAISDLYDHSLDSRYFGPFEPSQIIGRIYPIWTLSER